MLINLLIEDIIIYCEPSYVFLICHISEATVDGYSLLFIVYSLEPTITTGGTIFLRFLTFQLVQEFQPTLEVLILILTIIQVFVVVFIGFGTFITDMI